MITIELLNISHSKRLAEIISTDRILHKELSSSKPIKQTNADEYYSVCKVWEVEKNGVCYCILLDDVPIGSISISHRDFANKTASCGYWIESGLWCKGYTTKAFALVIEEARQAGFETLSSSINKQNIASIALWRRQGAVLEEINERVFPMLVLNSKVKNTMSDSD